MRIEPNDQKLTDYALGELDVSEIKELEDALLEPENKDALETVKEIRKTATLLSKAYKQESARTPGLDKARLAVFESGEPGEDKAKPKHYRLLLVWSSAIVLLVVGGFGVLAVFGDNIRTMFATSANSLAGSDQNAYATPTEPTQNMYAHKNLKSFGTNNYQGYQAPLGHVSLAAPPPSRARPDDGEGDPRFNTEAYDSVSDNEFMQVTQNPLSTFSIDVDTASYANVRRFLNSNRLPPSGSVRIEEMINYFDYDYPQPTGDHPFSVNVDVAEAPWTPAHRLVRIGLKGREIPWENRPASNLVFLIDVSGSMNSPNKLPLLRESMKLLVEKLDERDRVAMVVYAGSSGLVLDSTTCDKSHEIMSALDRLQAGGSTHGSAGIQLAYKVATENLIPEGNNRIVLATDGDFNVGTTGQGDLVELIEEKAKSGVFLTVLGFGMGNYKDSTLEKLADKGNGNYAYIDTLKEAKKVLVQQIGGTLVTIAKDVKIQVEFNPSKVQAYRLVGYENRLLAKEDFNDDTKDAGEIGSGHTVTALYEVVPPGVKFDHRSVDALKYQKPSPAPAPAQGGSDELMTVKLRYKEPDGWVSKLIERPVSDKGQTLRSASPDFRFAASVAAFGMLLRDSKFKGEATFGMVKDLAASARTDDPHGYRAEFEKLVEKAEWIGNRPR